MRVLFLINFYPPFELGGQEKSCKQVVEGLHQRGHSTLVLTSDSGVDKRTWSKEDGVLRELRLEMDLTPLRHSLNFFTQRKAREKENIEVFERVLNEFRPDVIFVWGMWNLPRSLPRYVEDRCRGRTLFRFATYWPTLPSQHVFYWRKPGRKWYSQILKKILAGVALRMLAEKNGQIPLTFSNSMCVSQATKDELLRLGVPIENARVIHTGLDAGQFLANVRGERERNSERISLLYAGRLEDTKGLEVAIEAVGRLVHKFGLKQVHFDIVGSGAEEYVEQLRKLARERGVDEYVSFLGRVPYEDMGDVMQAHDILLVPSTWPEPFARVLLEGMAAGMLVIASNVGGSGEIVEDGVNGLLIRANDAVDLAEKLALVVREEKLRLNLSRAGQATVAQNFTIEHMLDEIESFLLEIVGEVTRENRSSKEIVA